MKAEELRVSNLVMHNGIVKEVESIRWDGIGDTVNSFGDVECQVPFKELEPIPITDEWLKMFGLGSGSSNLYFFSNTNMLGYMMPDAYGCNGNWGLCIDDEKMIFIEIKHVHSLQNIYHALTGEELQLKKK